MLYANYKDKIARMFGFVKGVLSWVSGANNEILHLKFRTTTAVVGFQ